jgi:hypothetical protein
MVGGADHEGRRYQGVRGGREERLRAAAGARHGGRGEAEWREDPDRVLRGGAEREEVAAGAVRAGRAGVIASVRCDCAMNPIEDIEQFRLQAFAENLLRTHFARVNSDDKEGFRAETAVGRGFPTVFEKYYTGLRQGMPLSLENVRTRAALRRSAFVKSTSYSQFEYRVVVEGEVASAITRISFKISILVDEGAVMGMVAGRIPLWQAVDSSSPRQP